MTVAEFKRAIIIRFGFRVAPPNFTVSVLTILNCKAGERPTLEKEQDGAHAKF